MDVYSHITHDNSPTARVVPAYCPELPECSREKMFGVCRPFRASMTKGVCRPKYDTNKLVFLKKNGVSFRDNHHFRQIRPGIMIFLFLYIF